MSACSRCSARCCTAGLANTIGGNRNKLAHCRSRNTLAELSNAYLVKPRNLLPGPGKGEKSKPSDPHKTAHLFKYLGVETHDSVSPVPCSALGFEVSLGEDVPRPHSKPPAHLQLKESV